VFKVEEIRDRRRRDGEIEYLIKWEGWARCVAWLTAESVTLPGICPSHLPLACAKLCLCLCVPLVLTTPLLNTPSISDDNSWEPAENVADDLVASFEAARKTQRGRSFVSGVTARRTDAAVARPSLPKAVKRAVLSDDDDEENEDEDSDAVPSAPSDDEGATKTHGRSPPAQKKRANTIIPRQVPFLDEKPGRGRPKGSKNKPKQLVRENPAGAQPSHASLTGISRSPMAASAKVATAKAPRPANVSTACSGRPPVTSSASLKTASGAPPLKQAPREHDARSVSQFKRELAPLKGYAKGYATALKRPPAAASTDGSQTSSSQPPVADPLRCGGDNPLFEPMALKRSKEKAGMLNRSALSARRTSAPGVDKPSQAAEARKARMASFAASGGADSSALSEKDYGSLASKKRSDAVLFDEDEEEVEEEGWSASHRTSAFPSRGMKRPLNDAAGDAKYRIRRRPDDVAGPTHSRPVATPGTFGGSEEPGGLNTIGTHGIAPRNDYIPDKGHRSGGPGHSANPYSSVGSWRGESLQAGHGNYPDGSGGGASCNLPPNNTSRPGNLPANIPRSLVPSFGGAGADLSERPPDASQTGRSSSTLHSWRQEVPASCEGVAQCGHRVAGSCETLCRSGGFSAQIQGGCGVDGCISTGTESGCSCSGSGCGSAGSGGSMPGGGVQSQPDSGLQVLGQLLHLFKQNTSATGEAANNCTGNASCARPGEAIERHPSRVTSGTLTRQPSPYQAASTKSTAVAAALLATTAAAAMVLATAAVVGRNGMP
jgi:hypothetical protein